MHITENTQGILVIYEEAAEEWALYLKSIFKHIILEDRILLYDLEAASIYHSEVPFLCSYRCKLLIISNGLLKGLNLKKRYFLNKILQPPERVAILLCGVEDSTLIYQTLNIDKCNQLMTTDQGPEDYLAVISDIIQQGAHDPLSSDLERSLRLSDGSVESEEVTETVGRPEVLVLPKRIPCECPGEMFIILRDDVPEDSVIIEFITENEWIRIEPDFWNQKVRFIKALDFPAGFVNVNIYCGGDIKATVQIEYYSTVGEFEKMLQKVADPIAFACQAFKFSSAEKMDNILTLLLKSSIISHDFSSFPNEVTDHDQEIDLQLEELPTLLHCAAKFGLKKLAALLLQDPKVIQACRITNKYGENPAHVAKKYGQKEIWKILAQLSINEDKNTSDEKEIKAEDDIYVFMMSSDSHSNGLGRPSIEEPPGAYLKIQKKKEMNADAEPKEYNEEGMVEKEEGNKLEENTCHLRNSCYGLYSNIFKDVPEAKSENVSVSEGPPLPPRNQSVASKQSELFYLYSACKRVEGQTENKETDGEPKINDYFDEIDGEDPYTSAVVNDGVYDTIIDNKLQEQRKDGRSFIMNRPPAPAPRPLSVAAKEESTSYIAQVFQQKVTRTHAGNEKLLNAVRKPGTPMTTKFNESELIKEMAMKLNDRSYEDKVTYTIVKPKIPPSQEEHLLFQQQLKKGNSSMDEIQKLKHWQIHTSKPETTQQVMGYFREQLNTDNESGL
ncbi:B-cell scaffold protein with ankyrin repeats [Protobothrops mucrosquamatus]|uniref:B-cell scaffold protein with ankyrin repeats n=1 Tax=Protobothrops mucrosquamatus TaxID=103944 RepID=UPI0010FB4F06|nr:B-cell scaffold protein with ankyrin repeats [Protobothrops mucrosquamatus]